MIKESAIWVRFYIMYKRARASKGGDNIEKLKEGGAVSLGTEWLHVKENNGHFVYWPLGLV